MPNRQCSYPFPCPQTSLNQVVTPLACITTLPNNRNVATGCCSQDCFAAAAVARLSSKVAAAADQAPPRRHPNALHTPDLGDVSPPKEPNPFPMHCPTTSSRTAHLGQQTRRCWHCHQRSPAGNLGTRSRVHTHTPACLAATAAHSLHIDPGWSQCGLRAAHPFPTHAHSAPVAVAALRRPLQQGPPLRPAHPLSRPGHQRPAAAAQAGPPTHTAPPGTPAQPQSAAATSNRCCPRCCFCCLQRRRGRPCPAAAGKAAVGGGGVRTGSRQDKHSDDVSECHHPTNGLTARHVAAYAARKRMPAFDPFPCPAHSSTAQHSSLPRDAHPTNPKHAPLSHACTPTPALVAHLAAQVVLLCDEALQLRLEGAVLVAEGGGVTCTCVCVCVSTGQGSRQGQHGCVSKQAAATASPYPCGEHARRVLHVCHTGLKRDGAARPHSQPDRQTARQPPGAAVLKVAAAGYKP